MCKFSADMPLTGDGTDCCSLFSYLIAVGSSFVKDTSAKILHFVLSYSHLKLLFQPFVCLNFFLNTDNHLFFRFLRLLLTLSAVYIQAVRCHLYMYDTSG